MIKYWLGDIFKAKDDALVNPINCIGVAGGGMNRACRDLYPANYEAVRKASYRGDIGVGRVFVFLCNVEKPPRYILNFPTKTHFRVYSRVEWIAEGMCDLARVAGRLGLHSLALPLLGCGLGRLRWADVRPYYVWLAEQLPQVQINVYIPRRYSRACPMPARTQPDPVQTAPAP